FAHQIARALKRLFTLAAKTDDKVAADRHPRHALAAALEHLTIILNRIESLHSLEHFVAARLRGDVQIRADLGKVANGVEEIIAHVLGEIRDELDALDASGIVNVRQQVGKADTTAIAQHVLIAVDGLTKERNFLAAFCRELADFGGDVFRM